jgi:hypothetical protein
MSADAAAEAATEANPAAAAAAAAAPAPAAAPAGAGGGFWGCCTVDGADMPGGGGGGGPACDACGRQVAEAEVVAAERAALAAYGRCQAWPPAAGPTPSTLKHHEAS